MAPLLLDLPNELLLTILTFIHPKGVVVLRQTCRRLNNLCGVREVWADQLRQICDGHGAPHSVYASGAMDALEIEATVLHPHRLRAALRDWSVASNLSPHFRAPKTFPAFNVPSCMDSSGRFVVCEQRTDASECAELWDTRSIDVQTGIPQAQLIAYVKRTQGRLSWPCSIFTRGDSDTLDVMIVLFTVPCHDTDTGRESTLQLHQLRVQPFEEPKETSIHSELVLTPSEGWGLPAIDVQDNLIACFHRAPTNMVIIWDYPRSRIDFWDLVADSACGGSCRHQPFLRGTDIYLGSHGGTLEHWKIEPEIGFLPMSARCIADAKPGTRLPSSSLGTPSLDRWDIVTYFFPNTIPSPYFGIVKSIKSSPRRQALSVYSIHRTEDGENHYEEMFVTHLDTSYFKRGSFFEDDIILWRHNGYMVPMHGLEYSIISDFRLRSDGVGNISWTNIGKVLHRTVDEVDSENAKDHQIFRMGDTLIAYSGANTWLLNWFYRTDNDY